MLGGLRGRLVGALVLTSAVTLAVAAYLLLAPLESRIRADEIENIGHQVRASRSTLTRLERTDVRPGSSDLHRAAKLLKARVGGDFVIVGSGPPVLAATDFDLGQQFPEAVEALRRGRTVHAITGGGSSAIVHVAVPLRIGGKRVAVVAIHRLNDAGEAAAVVKDAFVGAAAISLAIALLLGSLLASQLVQRLRALRDTALRVSELGPVVEMRADETNDEVGDLTRALAIMQNRLREQEHARRAFVSTASHELRTPLSSLRVMLDLLRGDLEGETPDLDDARRQADRADQQAERLARLAADLLDLSRLDAGLPVRREVIDLPELTRAVVAEFDVRTQTSAQEIIVEADGGSPLTAVGDPGSVAQVIRILLDNATRHGPPAGVIRIKVAPVDGRPSVSVSDEGGGIVAGERERIFERFERGEETTEAPGFGLGLAIGRELATRMDADLDLEPAACTTFRLTLAPAMPPG